MQKFVDPYSKLPLVEDNQGNLRVCGEKSNAIYRNHGGSFDFAARTDETAAERDFYNDEYQGKALTVLEPHDLAREWECPNAPWLKAVLSSLGDFDGKRMLLVGNGNSRREFLFPQMGANVVFSDLSIEAVKHAKRQYDTSPFADSVKGTAEFHAVDALNLSFHQESFDVIYGFAFVHHLSDSELETFLLEVHRCLKPGGFCRFQDQAYSPMWRCMTQTVFYPLKLWSYRKIPRSPADLRADQEGNGFKHARLSFLKKKCGFRRLLFRREWFFHRVATRHIGLFSAYGPTTLRRAQGLFRVTKWLDERLANSRFMNKNGIMLVWGFDK